MSGIGDWRNDGERITQFSALVYPNGLACAVIIRRKMLPRVTLPIDLEPEVRNFDLNTLRAFISDEGLHLRAEKHLGEAITLLHKQLEAAVIHEKAEKRREKSKLSSSPTPA